MKRKLETTSFFAATIGLVISAWLAIFYAPIDANMGIVQKIFYFHVPSAYSMYLCWAVCTVGSLVYLTTRSERWDMLAKSAAELALLFALLVMITGPLWGRKSWGAYWAWDPRLTSSLLFTLIIVSYTLLRTLSSGEVEKKFAAALAILGACIMPLIHISVYKWRGQHPTVITSSGGGLAPEMKTALMTSFAAFSLLVAALISRRYSLESKRRRLSQLEESATACGLEEEA